MSIATRLSVDYKSNCRFLGYAWFRVQFRWSPDVIQNCRRNQFKWSHMSAVTFLIASNPTVCSAENCRQSSVLPAHCEKNPWLCGGFTSQRASEMAKVSVNFHGQWHICEEDRDIRIWWTRAKTSNTPSQITRRYRQSSNTIIPY